MSLGRELSKAFSGLEKRIAVLEKENTRLRKKLDGGGVKRGRKTLSKAAKKVGKRGPGRPPKEVTNEEAKPKRRGRPATKKQAPQDNTPKKRGRPPVDRSIPKPKKRGRPPLPEHLLKHNPFAHRIKPGQKKEAPVVVLPPPPPPLQQEEIEIDEDKNLLEMSKDLPEDDDDAEDLSDVEVGGVGQDIPFADDDDANEEPEADADDE